MKQNKAQLNTLVPIAIRQWLEDEAQEYQVSLSDISRHYLKKGIGETTYRQIVTEGGNNGQQN